MSDFMSQGNLQKFWENIMNLHWMFLETEESREKLDIRKELEDNLKEFLGVVQHDRKFFLPETQEVLKSSIRDLDDFSAQKAITAFDWISQYANNLISKPWRKEFRILKMYSGFYQNEIKANLLNAEILFEAMGYRHASKDILIFDGPICPDQLANVSRDAMTAYVELQIIKHIYAGLDAIDLHFSYFDIYRHREKYTGSVSQVVQTLAYAVEEKRHRSRQKSLAADNYGFIDVQPSSNYFSTNVHHCAAQCQCERFQQIAPVLRHRTSAQSNGICCVAEHRQQTPTNLVYNNKSKTAQYQYSHHPGMSSESDGAHLPHMSHSRSLEHYSEASNPNILPQRHSFDHQLQERTAHQYYHPHYLQQEQQQQQQQHQYQHQHKNYYHPVKQHHQNLYESPYDIIDGNSTGGGSSNMSYAAVAGASTPITRASAGGVGSNYNLNSTSAYHQHPYNTSGNRVPLPLNISNQLHVYNNPDFSSYSTPQVPVYDAFSKQQMRTSALKYQQNYLINTNGTNLNQSSNGLQNHSYLQDSVQGQPSFQSEQITNFKDLNVLQPATPHYYQSIETSNGIMDNYYSVSNGLEKNLLPPTTSSCQQHSVSGKPSTNGDIYAKSTRRDIGSQYEYNSGEREDTTDMSCESANDQTCPKNKCNRLGSSAQFARSHDGSGSTAYCSYPEKSSSSKDLDKYKDVNVESLNIEALNINKDPTSCQNNSADKKIFNYSGNKIREREYSIGMSYQSAKEQTCPKNKCNRLGTSAHFAKSHDGSSSTGYCNYQEKNCSPNDLDKNKDVNAQSLNINKDPTSCQNNSADKKISDYSGNKIREREYSTDTSCQSAKELGSTGYYNNQEQNCSSKDLDKNKDVNVQSLDMGLLNINKDSTLCHNNSADKQISDYSGNEIKSAKQVQQLEPNEKNKSSGNENSLSANNSIENAVHNTSSSAPTNYNKNKIKSALKQTSSKSNTNNPNYQSNRTQRKTSDNKKYSKAMNNNNNNESLKHYSNETTQRKSSPSAAVNINKSLPNNTTNTTPPHSTGIIVTDAKEWSCSFCTFINPKNTRVCEMCAHSKGFEMDSSTTSTASTGGTTVARNTPTCA